MRPWRKVDCPNSQGGKAGLDQLWLYNMLAMIGEQFDEGNEICGAVASVRARQENITLWTRIANNEAAQGILSTREEMATTMILARVSDSVAFLAGSYPLRGGLSVNWWFPFSLQDDF
jgi:predicted mannosyl-3-phosphoglycerate phosphatase (HAD superfamily)